LSFNFCSFRPGILLRDRIPVFFSAFSVPDFKEAVPGSCAHGHAILGDAKAADSIVVTGKNTWNKYKSGINTCLPLKVH
jgi:hypothetical protein